MILSKHWLVATMALSSLAGAARAANPICNLVFDKCPGNFTSGTITVPPSVIWLDPQIPVCSENVQVQTGTNSAPPSIIFVIDNSGSMSFGDVDNSNGNDGDEARFRVVRDMLDTIAKASPTAEVGMVIFTRRLQFDHRDNPFFKTAFPADTSQHDAYVPLTQLNKDFGNGVKGVDTLKALLAYTGNGNLVYATKRPGSRHNTHYADDNLRDGTDITLGFEAAKTAMADAKAAKSDQYIIFLSDGEPSNVDQSREGIVDNFQAGTNVPTTFTVFFRGNTSNPTAPATIVTMTNAIKNNGYSATNTKSDYWAINQPGVQLSSLLQTNVLNPIFSNTPGRPVTAVMTVSGTQYTSTGVDAKNFTFGKRVPLSADQTTVNLVYTYQYTDSGKTKTKDVPYALTVKRGAAGTAFPAGISSACQDQGDITLYNKDTQVTLVTADHTDLDVHLTLANGETCNGCKVEVKPSKSGDRENITLAPASGYQKGNFGRETSISVVPGDGKLQHLPADSIIITYVNPDNPLDVIRKAFPYSDVSTQLTLTKHNQVAHSVDIVGEDRSHQFVVVAPGAVNFTTSDAKNWNVINTLAPGDSIRYVGNVVEASRPFKVEIEIFSNLGQFVNKISFTVPQSEFTKLAQGLKSSTRRLRVLWDNRTQDGNPAGTGAYIMKTTVTLLKIPGISNDEASSTDFRIVGVLRSK